MNKLQQKFRQFMQGRYGVDELSRVIAIAGLTIYVLGSLFRSGFLLLLGMVGMILFFVRSLSRNVMARYQENTLFLRYIKLWKMRFAQRGEYRIFMCRRCKKFIRVPKGKGKVEITCPTCGNREIHRT